MRQEYKVAKTLMKSLKTELSADLPSIAALLQSKGRGKDTILAHITPKEAALLKKRGGRGSTNPDTGLLEFDDGGTIDFGAGFQGTPEQTSAAYGLGGQTPTPTPAAPELTSTATPIDQAPASSGGGFQAESSAAPISDIPVGGSFQGISAPGQAAAPAAGFAQNIAPPALSGYQPSTDYSLGAGLPQPAPGTSLTKAPATGAGATSTDKTLLQQLGLTPGQALGAGLSSLIGINTARNASAQGQQAKQELAAQAAPYQQQGKALVSAAQAGQLSTASQQSYQAAQAQAAQAAARGGISGAGVVQTQAALENLRQQLLANDLNIGLQIQSIGDKIAQGAISAGVQADQYVNNLTSNYATNIARTLAGLGGTPQTPTTPVRTA
jgi:hypothetical protein